MTLKIRIQDDVKTALRAGEKQRLGALRLISAAIKQKEVDERVELDDAGVLAVLDKMVKQRRDSLEQYRAAGREDLANQEQFELDLIGTYLPEPLDSETLQQLIREVIGQVGADKVSDMGRVMNALRPHVQGRADMKAVSQAVRAELEV